jgi:HD-like signal output (HDOD) protein
VAIDPHGPEKGRMKVLFVDDEPQVLDGLERSLTMLVDDEWELEFVASGAAALARLADGSFDAVVSDMRMPGIDGAEVLERARQISPRTVRIVLSGQMESSSTLRAIEHAHQILCKPCRGELLYQVLRASLRFRDLLEDEGFRAAVVAVDRLPAVPSTYRAIEAELRHAETSPNRISEIVARDPGLSARVLQVARSPFFGSGRPPTDVRQATNRLGLQMISALAMAAVFDPCDRSARELDLSALAAASLRTASIAAALRPAATGEAYLAGLLTDVGMIVLALARPERFDETCVRARDEGVSFVELERGGCGVGHAEVGAYLLALWGLPENVVDAVRGHHAPERDGYADPQLVRMVAIAAALSAGTVVDDDTLHRAGIDAALLSAARACAA